MAATIQVHPGGNQMSADENKAVVRAFIDEVWNRGNFAAEDQYFAPDIIVHDPPLPGLPAGAEGAKKIPAFWHRVFPDIVINIDDMVAEGDMVVERFTMHGTHEGELFGLAPTGKRVTMGGILFLRIADGKIVERWATNDTLGLLQQLGAIPAPPNSHQ
jgi:steroid delta-isomerase-like uncharacterized protein